MKISDAAAGISGRGVNPGIRLISPPSDIVKENPPLIQIEMSEYPQLFILFLDGVDVTPVSYREEGKISYRPDGRLSAGEHRIKLLVAGDTGTTEMEWTFNVSSKSGEAGPSPGKGAIYTKGGLSLSADQVFAEKDVAKHITVNGNLNMNLGIRRKDTDASITGNVRYLSTDPEDNFSLSNFSALIKHKDDSLSFGDVSFRGTPLTAPSFSRRGLLGVLNHFDAEFQIFQAKSSNVTGFHSVVDFTSSEDQVYGAAISRSFFKDNPFKITAVFITGENSSPSSYNTGSIEAPSKGQVAGLLSAGSLLGTNISAEVGWSKFDSDILTPDNVDTDKAGTIQVGRTIGGVSLSGTYQYAGPEFASVASPNATRDRQQFGISAATGLGISSLSASLSRSNDNVKGDKARPVVFNTSLGGTYAISMEKWPSLTLSYIHGLVDSTKEPSGNPGVDNTTDTATAGISYGRKGWSGNLTSSLSWLNDNLSSGQDSKTSSHQLSFAFQPSKGINFAPSMGWTETKKEEVRQQSGLAAINLNLVLFPNILTLASQGSFTQNKASDHSAETRQINGVLRTSLNIHEMVKRWVSYGQETLALSISYNNSEDQLDPSKDQKSFRAFVSINFFAPLDWSHGF